MLLIAGAALASPTDLDLLGLPIFGGLTWVLYGLSDDMVILDNDIYT